MLPIEKTQGRSDLYIIAVHTEYIVVFITIFVLYPEGRRRKKLFKSRHSEL